MKQHACQEWDINPVNGMVFTGMCCVQGHSIIATNAKGQELYAVRWVRVKVGAVSLQVL
jgi:hypothetical protein